ncbi:MAG: glycosyl hydrolase [Patescibacteria group bacterium]
MMAKTVGWRRLRIKSLVGLLVVVLLSFTLTMSVTQLPMIRQFFSHATQVPADIIIKTQNQIGPLPRPWRNLAQGGESHNWQLSPIQSQVSALHPDYIRLDHIYDFYEIVSGTPGNLTFDFTKLDSVLDQISAVGAKPFISLSYLPPAISRGDIVDQPVSYSDWTTVVQRTIEHVSGTRNTRDVYYEVWNEPDLFGGWKYYGAKNYLELYKAAAIGVSRAQVRQTFKFGGPATTAPYKNWFDALATFTSENNLRFDFYSWHRYTTDINQYIDDMRQVQRWLTKYPMYESNLELIVTEWGHDSDNHAGYDGSYSAAHTVAGAISMIGVVDRAFVFEIQDGVDPAGNEFWGRWGLITAPGTNQKQKSRYQALIMLDSLPNQRIQLTGNGSAVKGLATQAENGSLQVILANFDSQATNWENVPVTFDQIQPGNYQIQLQYLSGRQATQRVATTAGILQTTIPMKPSDVVKLEFKPE